MTASKIADRASPHVVVGMMAGGKPPINSTPAADGVKFFARAKIPRSAQISHSPLPITGKIWLYFLKRASLNKPSHLLDPGARDDCNRRAIRVVDHVAQNKFDVAVDHRRGRAGIILLSSSFPLSSPSGPVAAKPAVMPKYPS